MIYSSFNDVFFPERTVLTTLRTTNFRLGSQSVFSVLHTQTFISCIIKPSLVSPCETVSSWWPFTVNVGFVHSSNTDCEHHRLTIGWQTRRALGGWYFSKPQPDHSSVNGVNISKLLWANPDMATPSWRSAMSPAPSSPSRRSSSSDSSTRSANFDAPSFQGSRRAQGRRVIRPEAASIDRTRGTDPHHDHSIFPDGRRAHTHRVIRSNAASIDSTGGTDPQHDHIIF
ncbi:hypothetical protein GE09DRAFT_676685 [Coniochaeta sp. 2T2.1]|nr:hypothetical protein GE09DRAFT_676685 [Coniochaeta sp. 2T2.1]